MTGLTCPNVDLFERVNNPRLVSIHTNNPQGSAIKNLVISALVILNLSQPVSPRMEMGLSFTLPSCVLFLTNADELGQVCDSDH